MTPSMSSKSSTFRACYVNCTNESLLDLEQKAEGGEVPFQTPEFMEQWSDHDKAGRVREIYNIQHLD